ncbi:Poly(3-hydroxybutyrate) depolymerase [Hydrogenophaga sp. T4]|nr:Poly(3-hydroxybutyrate) depolymerase [Hydrogenophaga sp. T4]
MARPGVYGSTVLNHRYQRRTHEEVAVVSAAIDQIKARYGLDRISLAGQSGGGYLALAMVVSGRTDIDAVAASGAPAAVRLAPPISDPTRPPTSARDRTGEVSMTRWTTLPTHGPMRVARCI